MHQSETRDTVTRIPSSDQLSWRGKIRDLAGGVDILWPDGETEVIKGFITEHDAAKWIAEHSRALQGNTNEVTPNALGTPAGVVERD